MKSRDHNMDRIQTAITDTFRRIVPEMMAFQELGLTGPQYHLISNLGQNCPCKITELADNLEVKPSAITVMIDRLAQHGFVSRHYSASDRRVVLITLTDEGKRVLELAQNKAKAVMRQYFSRLEPGELEQLANLHEKLADIVQDVPYDGACHNERG